MRTTQNWVGGNNYNPFRADFVPPTRFRGDGIAEWIEQFAAATVKSARLARAYVIAVGRLQKEWRNKLREKRGVLRADAAALAIIDILPAHPMISAPVAGAVTDRAKSRIYEAIGQLVEAGVLLPVSEGKRNRWWEASGLLDLVTRLESGQFPPA